MSMISEFRSTRVSLSELDFPVTRYLNQILKAYRHRKALQQLLEAEDHMLADVGLTRDDVRHAQAHIPARQVGDYLTKVARR